MTMWILITLAPHRDVLKRPAVILPLKTTSSVVREPATTKKINKHHLFFRFGHKINSAWILAIAKPRGIVTIRPMVVTPLYTISSAPRELKAAEKVYNHIPSPSFERKKNSTWVLTIAEHCSEPPYGSYVPVYYQ